MSRARVGVVALLGATLSGFVAAHLADYAVVIRDPYQRAHVLAHSGHAYFHGLAVLAAALLAAVVVTQVRRGRSEPARGARAGLAPAAAVALLAAVQSAFYCAAEVVERVVAHEPVTALPRSPLLPVGLLLQVAVAALLVALLCLAEAAGRALPRYAPRTTLAVPSPLLVATPYVSPLLATGAPRRVRGRAPPA